MADELQAALILQELRQLAAMVRENTEEQKILNRDHEQRLRIVEAKLTQLGERLTLWQVFQTTLTAIGSGVAVFFGRQP